MPTHQEGFQREITNRIPSPEDEILTLEGTAAYLKVKRRTLYDLVQRDKIPFLRVGRLLRFSRKDLLEWMQHGAVPRH